MPYIISKCPVLRNCAISEPEYLAIAGAARTNSIDTSKVHNLALLGDDRYMTNTSTYKQFHREQLHPSFLLFTQVNHLVVNNAYSFWRLTLNQYPHLSAVAVCARGSIVDIREITACINSATNLQYFIIVFCAIYRPKFVRWIKRYRPMEKHILLLESAINVLARSNDGALWIPDNDLCGWKSQIAGGTPFWERAVEYTAHIEHL